MNNEYTYRIVITFEDGQSSIITEDEVNSLELNLEHGYDVDSIIGEVFRKREVDSRD
jgi:hypothetical protein